MPEIGISSVSEKGQVTIPKEMRDILGLKAGDKVVFIDQNDQFVMRKARTGKLSQTLENQKAWKADASEFQRKIRKEWD